MIKTPAPEAPKTKFRKLLQSTNTNKSRRKNQLPKLGGAKTKVAPLDLTQPKRDPSEPNPFDELAMDPELERLVVLQMAMQRQQQGGTQLEKLPPAQPKPTHVPRPMLSEGFFWREYPACEHVLYKHMIRYYEVSAIQRNYKTQQSFNNVLVDEVRQAAIDNGFEIEISSKKLRDRIRCFYKTHLQNAKKRLATLQKHRDSVENQNLVSVFIRCVRNPDLSFEDSLAQCSGETAEQGCA